MADLISMLAAAAGAAAGGGEEDPFFQDTVLLLHGDGTNGAQNNTFLDSSTNAFTITRNGNTTQGTFSPFSKPDGRWGVYFDGSGDYLTIANNAALQFGTGDFTVEGWFFAASSAASIVLFSIGRYDAGILMRINSHTPSNDSLYINGTAYNWDPVTNFPINQWNHVALVRTGTTLYVFVNGTQVFTTTNSANISQSTDTNIAAQTHSLGTSPFLGSISNFRILKGTALYTSAFTPPTAPLTAISGTSLLTCQSNRFVDNSSNAFAITRNGDVKVTTFSPFPITTAYSPSVNGGAAYLDGTGDFLTVGTTINWSTFGNYTLEFWAYHVTLSTTVWYLVSDDFSAGETGWYVYSDGSIAVGINTVNQIVSSAGAVKAGQWQHIAYTYDGTTTKIYVNGVEVASGTTAVYANVSASISTGTGGGNTLVGYLSGMRIVDSVVYSSAFTPPTAPPTAISGTEVLLNFTNAGILDNTGFNALETVGNAQVDTTTKKYGTGSIEFDGTGDYLLLPSGQNMAFGTGDFTVECWVNFTGLANYRAIIDTRASVNSTNGWVLGVDVNGAIYIYSNGFLLQSSNGAISTSTFHHIAYVRASGTHALYVDGTSVDTDATARTYSDTLCAIGGSSWSLGTELMYGFIDDLRITKGVARYTTTFTPPTKAFPDLGE